MKIGEFFEKHVQWIAMGLAGAWLLWVGWTYGVNRPQVEVNGQTFSAGTVDEYIRDNDMQALANKMSVQSIPEGLVDVPDFTDAFVNAMKGQPPGQLPVAVVNSPPPYQLTPILVSTGPRRIAKVDTLPIVVTPTEVAVTSGRSQIIQPPEKPKVLTAAAGNPNAANANAANNATPNEGATAARPNIFDNNAQPQPPQPQPAAAAVPAAAPLPGQPAGVQMDRTWVTVFAKLNFNEQDKEFTKVNLPEFLKQKQYIEVQLQRQEVLAEGGFGTIEVVRALPMNQPPVERSKPAEFIKWSADSEAQKMILAPPFYFVVRGSNWEIPRKDVPAVAQAQQEVFDLAAKYQEYKQLKNKAEQDKFIAALPADQKKPFYDYRREQEAAENKAKAPPPSNQRQPANRGYVPGGRGPGGAGGAGRTPPREGNFDAVDPALLREMYADDDPAQRRRQMPGEYDAYLRRRDNLRRNFDEEYYGRRRLPFEEGMQPQGQQQILGNLVPDALGNVDIWAHDETAMPGRTYRYRVRAVIRNPLYDTKNIATNPKMQEAPYLPADLATGQLDANSSWSDWSKPVAIPTNVDMMLVSAQTLNGREFARFRVKRFQEGQINEAPRPFEVFPGDTIGGKEKVNVAAGAAPAGPAGAAKQIEVDFTTAWTLVDIRQAGGDYRVRIMDAQGRMEVRTVTGDRNRFKEEPAKAVGAVGSR